MLAVTILGNNSALPMHDRHPTAQVVSNGEQKFLVDCGEGAQIQMNRFKIRRSRIGHIFISHLHGDHYFGLPGLLFSYGLTGRTEPLHVYGPPMLERIVEMQMQAAESDFPFPLHFHTLGDDGLLVDLPKITVSSFRVSHRISCWGFLFREKRKPRKVDPEKAETMGVPVDFYPELKEGRDFVRPDGGRVANAEVTKPAPAEVSYAYCADTLYDERLIDIVKGSSLLYHESTYLDDQREKARLRFHSTAREAATIASKAGARRLLIGHFSSKYETPEGFREEAAAVFPNVELCREGVTYIA